MLLPERRKKSRELAWTEFWKITWTLVPVWCTFDEIECKLLEFICLWLLSCFSSRANNLLKHIITLDIKGSSHQMQLNFKEMVDSIWTALTKKAFTFSLAFQSAPISGLGKTQTGSVFWCFSFSLVPVPPSAGPTFGTWTILSMDDGVE